MRTIIRYSNYTKLNFETNSNSNSNSMWIESQTKSQNLHLKGTSKCVINKKKNYVTIFSYILIWFVNVNLQSKKSLQNLPTSKIWLSAMHLHNNTPCLAIWQWPSQTKKIGIKSCWLWNLVHKSRCVLKRLHILFFMKAIMLNVHLSSTNSITWIAINSTNFMYSERLRLRILDV